MFSLLMVFELLRLRMGWIEGLWVMELRLEVLKVLLSG